MGCPSVCGVYPVCWAFELGAVLVAVRLAITVELVFAWTWADAVGFEHREYARCQTVFSCCDGVGLAKLLPFEGICFVLTLTCHIFGCADGFLLLDD